VAKYGIKPLNKAAMVHQLVVIWNYLNQNNYLDDDDETSLENESENVVRDTENILSINSKASSDNIDHVKEPPGLSDNIKRKIKNHMISKYYEKIIRYEVNDLILLDFPNSMTNNFFYINSNWNLMTYIRKLLIKEFFAQKSNYNIT
jgi:hypothetical protein